MLPFVSRVGPTKSRNESASAKRPALEPRHLPRECRRRGVPTRRGHGFRSDPDRGKGRVRPTPGLPPAMWFVPDASTLALYALACVILFITPGPDMSLWLAKTVAGGRRGGAAAMLGTQAGCL